MRRGLLAAARIALWALGALGVLGAAVWAATTAGVVQPLVVLSESMRPAISAGDLLVAVRTATADVRVGDIVSMPQGDRLVTHRVTEIAGEATGWRLRLRGDANDVADPLPYDAGDAVLRVALVLPGVGAGFAQLLRAEVAVPFAAGVAALAGLVVLAPGAGRHRATSRSTPG